MLGIDLSPPLTIATQVAAVLKKEMRRLKVSDRIGHTLSGCLLKRPSTIFAMKKIETLL